MRYALPMKIWEELSGPQQTEALLNEIKGNLFEYLVGLGLCRRRGDEMGFLREFEEQDAGRAKDELVHYQSWLRENDPDLYARLPALSEQVVSFLLEREELSSTGPFKRVFVTGKRPGQKVEREHEEDLLIVLQDETEVPISLKICKKDAFVNTKSGGIRTFLEKYFSDFSGAKEAQSRVIEVLEKSFLKTSYKFYDWADLSWEEDDSSKSQFSPQWEESGLPTLPGELEEEPRSWLFEHYHTVISALYDEMVSFYREDEEKFIKCLGPIVGLGRQNLLQVTCFYDHQKDERYQLKTIKGFGWNDLAREMKSLSFPPAKDKISSFVMSFGGHDLQIRVKPMNKFTVCALKVNCSLKERR